MRTHKDVRQRRRKNEVFDAWRGHGISYVVVVVAVVRIKTILVPATKVFLMSMPRVRSR